MLKYLIFMAGCIAGATVTRFIVLQYRRTMPTVQEQIDAVMATSDPALAEDLLRLMEKRMVLGAGRPFSLGTTIGPVTIRTPERLHLALVLQDIPAFAAMVAGAQEAYPIDGTAEVTP